MSNRKRKLDNLRQVTLEEFGLSSDLSNLTSRLSKIKVKEERNVSIPVIFRVWEYTKYTRFFEEHYYEYAEMPFLIDTLDEDERNLCSKIICELSFQDVGLLEIFLSMGCDPEPLVKICLEKDYSELLDIVYSYGAKIKREDYEYAIKNDKKNCQYYYDSQEWFI